MDAFRAAYWPPPEAPTGLTATPGDSQIVLEWTPNPEPDMMAYVVYREIQTRQGTPIDTVYHPTVSYTDTDVEYDLTYSYRLVAADSIWLESEYSDPAVASLSLCGDANGDGEVTSGDGFLILNYFGAGPQPAVCWSANVNGDGDLTTGDGFHLLNHFGDPGAFPLNCALCEF
jgi:hypothetical protein